MYSSWDSITTGMTLEQKIVLENVISTTPRSTNSHIFDAAPLSAKLFDYDTIYDCIFIMESPTQTTREFMFWSSVSEYMSLLYRLPRHVIHASLDNEGDLATASKGLIAIFFSLASMIEVKFEPNDFVDELFAMYREMFFKNWDFLSTYQGEY